MSCFGAFLSDGKSYKYANNFIYKWETLEDKGEISNPKSDIIYRGNINMDDDNLDSAYINLINYQTNSVRKIMLNQMEVLPDNIIIIKDNVITISSLPLNSCIQIVEIPPFGVSDFNTNSVEIDIVINSNPFVITLPHDSTGKEYVIWVGNMCKKISL